MTIQNKPEITKRPTLTLKRKTVEQVVQRLADNNAGISKTHSMESIAMSVESEFNYDHEKVSKFMEFMWPKIFGGKFVPLELKIRKKILRVTNNTPDAPSELEIRHFLRLHCKSKEYRQCLATGEFRFGLDGEPVKKISTSHKLSAAEAVEKLFNVKIDHEEKSES